MVAVSDKIERTKKLLATQEARLKFFQERHDEALKTLPPLKSMPRVPLVILDCRKRIAAATKEIARLKRMLDWLAPIP